MPAFVKLRLNQPGGSKDIFVNPANVLSVVSTEDLNSSLVLLNDEKAYFVEGRPADTAKLLGY